MTTSTDRRPDLVRLAEAALSGLGTTADDVTASLLRAGCTGDHCSANTCPIARFLFRFGFREVTVVGDWAVVRTSSSSVEYWQIVLPDAVNDFVRDFDTNHYPQLERI
ncbi:hypothetical protein Pan216_30000 [Planctomycetes bacterium Pan216]|uniref:Uncharacterized protein n=1 Tax=Kolteria novifilia TaxID=2527975 RepID=A0A518B574_9BACT|nr:hypothetical protein Pan216_30000 [Planctomycetes bacterium Pan216]